MGSTVRSEEKHRFISIIRSEISSESKLVIPPKFAENYGEDIHGFVLLKAPRGAAWSVQVKRSEDSVWLTNGWPEFATFYSLSFGHFLVFEYQGSCKFKVVIYNKSGIQIDYPLQLRTAEKSVGVECQEQPGGNRDFEKRKEKLSESDDEEIAVVKKPKIVTASNVHRNQQVTANLPRRPATKEEKDRALASANTYRPKKPYFITIMKPSHIGRNSVLRVREDYMSSYVRAQGDMIILQVGQRSWVVKCSFYRKRCRLGAGWREFSEYNALAVGDVLVFELSNKSQKLVNVVIYRAVNS